MHWQDHKKHGESIFGERGAKNPEGRIPVSVVIGADQRRRCAGCCRFPPVLDEMMFADFCDASQWKMVPLRDQRLGSARQRGLCWRARQSE